MDLRVFDRRALDLAGGVVAAVGPDDLTRPTPCPPWTVADLLRHLVSQNLRFAAAAAGADPELACPLDGGDLGTDPARAYLDSAQAVTDAFAAPGLDRRRVVLPELSEPVPGARAVAFHFVDYLVHAWDVAVAVGAPLDPPDDLTETALGLAERIPDGPPTRGPGAAFGSRIVVPTTAPAYHRLLGLVGRDPEWSPLHGRAGR